MAGRKKSYQVEVDEKQRKYLNKVANSRKSPYAEVQRARIVVSCADHPDWSDGRVATEVGCSEGQVRKWRKRWCQMPGLKEAARPGRPRVFPPEVRAEVTALACSSPEQVGVALARWSCAELAVALVSLGLVAQIATSTVWRWLQAERLKPWRFHLWQHVRDPLFLERAKAVLGLYEQAVELLKAGIWVICVDEKTSLQARQGVDEPKPACPGSPVQLAARYVRRGALQLFAALSVADGQVYGCCRNRKCFADFKAFFLDVIVPAAIQRGVTQIRLILDHGPTHAPKQLEAWLTQQQLEQAWPFTVQVVWLPKYASWLDQIEIWFSVLQRKALTPNHFVDLEALRQRLLEFIAHYNRTAQPIQWSYTIAKLEEKFATN